LEYGSPRVKGYDEGTNQRVREDSLDQLDEARTVALIHPARYQQALRQYQARKIRRRDFNDGDLVIRLRQDNRGRHKLSPHGRDPTSWSKSAQSRYLKGGKRGRRGTHQRLEHPTATSLLPLGRISKPFFVAYIPNTPVGCTIVKSYREIKVKRATRLSP
jgi:hypothetical protein